MVDTVLSVWRQEAGENDLKYPSNFLRCRMNTSTWCGFIKVKIWSWSQDTYEGHLALLKTECWSLTSDLTDHLTNARFWTWRRSEERPWRVQNSPHHLGNTLKTKQNKTHVLLNSKSEAPVLYESVFTFSNTIYCLLKQKSKFIHVKTKSNKKTQFISSRLKL